MALLGGGSWNGNVMSAFSRNRRRILSLWLPRLPIDRINRRLGRGNAARGNPCIVVAKQNKALQISALDDAAARLGLEPGLPLANARAICPQLQIFDADEAADAKALNAIAEWCDRFTPLVALDSPHGLFLDITGCVHVFGGEAAMMRLGEAQISPRKPLPDYIVEKRFAEPVATDGVISATLSGLAEMLVAAMAQQGKGARRLEARFFRTDGAVRTIIVDTGQPVTRGEVIDRLFRERLDALSDPLDPGFGFDLIRLSASRTEIVVQQQRDLDANVHDNDELAALIDRIAARIGGKRVVVYLPQDTHLPERAALPAPAQHHLAAAMHTTCPARVEGEPPLRPFRRVEPPGLLKVTAPGPNPPPPPLLRPLATPPV